MSCKGLTGKALDACRTRKRDSITVERTRKRDSVTNARYRKRVLNNTQKIPAENSFFPDTAKVNAQRREVTRDRAKFLKEELNKKIVRNSKPLAPTQYNKKQ
tara:strand:+ start:302 stop:607 length:306 start_codon:yes stop_codon:yes gene_type:complete